MAVTEIDVEKAALFHDIGKVYQRADKLRKSHALVGKEALTLFLIRLMKLYYGPLRIIMVWI